MEIARIKKVKTAPKKFVSILLGGACAFAMLGSMSASAQTADDQADSDDDVARLGTITVTANKREQSLQDVATSIIAFDESAISERRLDTIENLVISSPGVQYQESGGTGQISIRGVGLLVGTGVAEPAVGTHIDGVFRARGGASTLQFMDLERIEVLRGPQGTLYGRNTTGGNINFISAKPTPEFEGSASIGFGSFEEFSAKGILSGPIAGDRVLGRVSAFYEENEGYYDNIFLNVSEHGHEAFGVKGALRFLPTDDITIDLSASTQNEERTGPVQPAFGPNPFVAQLVGLGIASAGFPTGIPEIDGVVALGGLSQGLVAPGEVVEPTGPFETASNDPSFSEAETQNITLDVNWSINENMNFRSLTAFTEHNLGPYYNDSDGTSLGIVNIGDINDPRTQDSKAFSQEFNLSGSTDNLDWLLGAYYFSEDLDAHLPAVFPDARVQALLGTGFIFVPDTVPPISTGFGVGTRFVSIIQDMEEETESQALFADLTYSLTDEFRLGFGARYTDDTKDVVQNLTSNIITGSASPLAGVPTVLFPPGTPFGIPVCTDLQTNQSFSDTNVKVRGEWDAGSDAMLYAQWQNGFKDGGVNLSACGDTFAEEEIEATEIGAKTTWMNGKLVINASAFFYDYTNYQSLAFRNATDAFVDNIPEAEVMGAEIEVYAQVTDALSFDLGVALLDSEIKEFMVFDEANPAGGVQDVSGNPLPLSPDYTINFGVDYGLELGDGSLDLRGEFFVSDGYDFRFFQNDFDLQDDYELINLYATYNFPGDNFSLRIFGKNVGDEEYRIQSQFASTTGPAGRFALPATWGAELKAKF